jgi:hypothetical protein
MNDTNWNLIIEFVHKYWPLRNKVLLRTTRLQEDLGIKGDDADNFISDFANTFKINTDNIDLSKYFEGHNDDLISFIIKLFKRGSGKTPKKQSTLTLGDLENALRIGQLDDKNIDDSPLAQV